MNISEEQIALWILGRPRFQRLLMQAFITAVTFYGAAFLSLNIESTIQTEQSFLYVHLPVFLLVLTALVFLFNFFSTTVEIVREKREHQKDTISHAYVQVDRLLSNRSAVIERSSGDRELLAKQFTYSLNNVKSIIDTTYNIFESVYGRSALPANRIDFEVTFMTKSLKDNEITIPAAANRDHKQPRSMIMRNADTTIYDNTVTAEIYEMDRPQMRIISDTTKESYAELYEDQKKRICSSVVYPVLSNSNRLLGTIVVHCDKSGFFSRGDRKYWESLLEIFAKRIAMETITMEALRSLQTDSVVEIPRIVDLLY